jgi:hypothetical protein
MRQFEAIEFQPDQPPLIIGGDNPDPERTEADREWLAKLRREQAEFKKKRATKQSPLARL